MISLERVKMWFGNELKRLMNEEGSAPRDIARHCEITSNLMNNYVQGNSLPKLWTLVVMADFLGVTVNDLLDFDFAGDENLIKRDPIEMFEDECEFAMHLHNRVYQQMMDSDTTVDDLSEKTGFSKATINRWFGFSDKDPELPRTSDFLSFCDALECTPSDLLGY